MKHRGGKLFEGTVATSAGKVRGQESDGCWSFLGIPYAASVAGQGRFGPPRPPEPWTGVFKADHVSPIAPQPKSGIGSYLPGDPMEQGENCLTLNVWAPNPDGALRPVIVFIHGGAFVSGTGSGVMYPGTHFARRGVVLVTLNYRLGFLGFLAHPGLVRADGAVSNRGLLDQLAAISWVRRNIEAFGGDAANITLVGESAGAMSIADLFGAGALTGLVHRAVLESGATEISSRKEAYSTAERFVRHLGLNEFDAALLRSAPLGELLAAQDAIIGESGGAQSMPFRPIIDGDLIRRHPVAGIASGATHGVDLLVGTNRDEFRLFTFAEPDVATMDDDALAKLVAGYLDDAAITVPPEEVVAAYRVAHTGPAHSPSSREIFESIGTDLVFRLPLIRLAEDHVRGGNRAFFYRFDWNSPFAQGALGACHALELPFVFGTLDNPIIGLFSGTGEDAFALSDEMQRAWVAFAATGSPATTGHSWPAYDERERTTRVFGGSVELIDAPGEVARDFFSAHPPAFGDDLD